MAALFAAERVLYFYFECGILAESQVNDVVSMDSCRRLNYQNIAKDHRMMCDAVNMRLHTNLQLRAASNTIKDALNQVSTLRGVVNMACMAAIAFIFTFARQVTQQAPSLPFVDRGKIIKND